MLLEIVSFLCCLLQTNIDKNFIYKVVLLSWCLHINFWMLPTIDKRILYTAYATKLWYISRHVCYVCVRANEVRAESCAPMDSEDSHGFQRFARVTNILPSSSGSQGFWPVPMHSKDSDGAKGLSRTSTGSHEASRFSSDFNELRCISLNFSQFLENLWNLWV